MARLDRRKWYRRKRGCGLFTVPGGRKPKAAGHQPPSGDETNGMTLPDPMPPNGASVERATDALKRAVDRHSGESVSFGELLDRLEDRAFAILLLILALPNCIPAPPGLNSIMGLPLMVVAVQLAMGLDHPVFPRWVAERHIPVRHVRWLVDRCAPAIRALERWSRPRVPFLATRAGHRLVGTMIVIYAVTILIPLPLTNFLPAIGVAIVAIGMLERDGGVMIVGVVFGAMGTIVAVGLWGTVVFATTKWALRSVI